MISNGALILAPLLLAACASPRPVLSKTEAVIPKPSDQILVCAGTINAYFYPGPAKTPQSVTVIVVLNKDPLLTKVGIAYREHMTFDARTAGILTDHREVCQQSPGDHCNALKDGDTLKITNGTSKMIVTTLELNTKSRELKYGAGGLDGGWSFTGTCSAP